MSTTFEDIKPADEIVHHEDLGEKPPVAEVISLTPEELARVKKLKRKLDVRFIAIVIM